MNAQASKPPVSKHDPGLSNETLPIYPVYSRGRRFALISR